MRAYARWGLWLYFRKVYLEYAERIPRRTTVIFALNHPTAFIEPVALGTHVDTPCWFMLRGDKFVHPAAAWFLRQIHNLPIFRAAHGNRAEVRGNVESMDFATDRVLEGEPTVILSEGSWSGRLRLKKVQRGTARMLFQAWRKDREAPVAIVPVGCHFDAPQAFRSSITLSFGQPIFARDYGEQHASDSRAAIESVTDELQRRLRQLVIHVEERERLELAESLLPLVRHGRPDSGVWPTSRTQPWRAAQWRAVARLNELDRVDARALAEEIDDYCRHLQRAEVTDSGVAYPTYGTTARALGLLALGPFAMAGWLVNFAPATLAARRAEPQRRSEQFFGSVRYGLGLGIFFAYALLWTIVFALLVGWLALLVPLLLYASAQLYLRWRESFTLWRDATRARSLPPDVLAGLRRRRREILATVGVAEGSDAVEVGRRA